MKTLEFAFEIGDRVYYDLPESDQGIVTDVTWRMSSGIVWYHVTFDPRDGEVACREFELTRERRVI